MLERFVLSDQDYEYLTKGIAFGVGCGVIVGAIIGNVTLAFAVGGVVGIIGSIAYSYYSKFKKKR